MLFSSLFDNARNFLASLAPPTFPNPLVCGLAGAAVFAVSSSLASCAGWQAVKNFAKILEKPIEFSDQPTTGDTSSGLHRDPSKGRSGGQDPIEFSDQPTPRGGSSSRRHRDPSKGRSGGQDLKGEGFLDGKTVDSAIDVSSDNDTDESSDESNNKTDCNGSSFESDNDTDEDDWNLAAQHLNQRNMDDDMVNVVRTIFFINRKRGGVSTLRCGAIIAVHGIDNRSQQLRVMAENTRVNRFHGCPEHHCWSTKQDLDEFLFQNQDLEWPIFRVLALENLYQLCFDVGELLTENFTFASSVQDIFGETVSKYDEAESNAFECFVQGFYRRSIWYVCHFLVMFFYY